MRQFVGEPRRFALTQAEALIVINHACSFTSQPMRVYRPVVYPVPTGMGFDTVRGSIVQPQERRRNEKRRFVLTLAENFDQRSYVKFGEWGLSVRT